MCKISVQRLCMVFLCTWLFFEISTASNILSGIFGGARNAPVVNPPVGKIRGSRITVAQAMEVYSFTGIPFAQPPVGQLRYKKPQPVKPWGDKTLVATKTPPLCMQDDVYYPRDLLWVPYEEQKSEDCLYLNIWTPTVDAKSRLAVMAYLPGGAYEIERDIGIISGGALAVVGGVVVVNIPYRLQSYGFLYDGTEDAPGNQGLFDSRMALQWIQDNIASFGGDPGKVTLFGWDAGGIITGFHLLSPESQNLFQRAIIQSGPPTKKGAAKERSLMLRYTDDFAQMFGCGSNSSDTNTSSVSVSCLRNVNASLITAAEQTFIREGKGKFEPIFGDEFLTLEPSEATFPGNKDVMIGHVANEGSILLYEEFRDTFSQTLPARKINKAEMIYFLGVIYKDMSLPDLNKFQQIYMGKIGDYDYEPLRQALAKLRGEEAIICPTYETVLKMAGSVASNRSRNNSVFLYEIDYVSACNKRRPWFGMSHGDELPLVFGQPFEPRKGCARDIPFSWTVIDLWSNFAKGRSPARPEWSSLFPESLSVVDISRNTYTAASMNLEARCKELKKLGLY